MEGIITALGTALTAVQTDALSGIGTALPIGLTVMGALWAIRVAVKTFKMSSK